MIDPRYQNALMAYLVQQQQPVNMLAAAEQGFDPDGPVARMLRAQRAAEAAKAQQGQRMPPRPAPGPQRGLEAPQSTLQRRMREAGVE
jgi:hypothetical protein